MSKNDFQKQLDALLENLQGKPTLLLHACCGPCSSYVLEYLSSRFEITVLFYNPNIYPASEYERRRIQKKNADRLELPLTPLLRTQL